MFLAIAVTALFWLMFVGVVQTYKYCHKKRKQWRNSRR